MQKADAILGLCQDGGMDKLQRAMQICGNDEPATVEAFQELQRLQLEASDEGDRPTEKERIGELFEAFYVKCSPETLASIQSLSLARQ